MKLFLLLRECHPALDKFVEGCSDPHHGDRLIVIEMGIRLWYLQQRSKFRCMSQACLWCLKMTRQVLHACSVDSTFLQLCIVVEPRDHFAAQTFLSKLLTLSTRVQRLDKRDP